MATLYSLTISTFLLILILVSSCTPIYLSTRLLDTAMPQLYNNCSPSRPTSSSHNTDRWYDLTSNTTLSIEGDCLTVLVEAEHWPSTPPTIMLTESRDRRHYAMGRLLVAIPAAIATQPSISIVTFSSIKLSSSSGGARFRWRIVSSTSTPPLPIIVSSLRFSEVVVHPLSSRQYVVVRANCSLRSPDLFHQYSIHYQQKSETILYGYTDNVRLLYQLDDRRNIYGQSESCRYHIENTTTFSSLTAPWISIDHPLLRSIRYMGDSVIEAEINMNDTATLPSSFKSHPYYGEMPLLTLYERSAPIFFASYPEDEIMALENEYESMEHCTPIITPRTETTLRSLYRPCTDYIDRRCSANSDCPLSTCDLTRNRCTYNSSFILQCISNLTNGSLIVSDALARYSRSTNETSGMDTTIVLSSKIDPWCDDLCPPHRWGFVVDDSDCHCMRTVSRIDRPSQSICRMVDGDGSSLCDQNLTYGLIMFCDGVYCRANITDRATYCFDPSLETVAIDVCALASRYLQGCYRDSIRIVTDYCDGVTNTTRSTFDPTNSTDRLVGFPRPYRFTTYLYDNADYIPSGSQESFDWEGLLREITTIPLSPFLRLTTMALSADDRWFEHSNVSSTTPWLTLITANVNITSIGDLSINVSLSGDALSLLCSSDCQLIVCHHAVGCVNESLSVAAGRPSATYGSINTSWRSPCLNNPLLSDSPLIVETITNLPSINLTTPIVLRNATISVYGDLVLLSTSINFQIDSPPIVVYGCLNGSASLVLPSALLQRQETKELILHNGCVNVSLTLLSDDNQTQVDGDHCYIPHLDYRTNSIALVYHFDCMIYVYIGGSVAVALFIGVVVSIVVYLRIRSLREKIAPFHDRPKTVRRVEKSISVTDRSWANATVESLPGNDSDQQIVPSTTVLPKSDQSTIFSSPFPPQSLPPPIVAITQPQCPFPPYVYSPTNETFASQNTQDG